MTDGLSYKWTIVPWYVSNRFVFEDFCWTILVKNVMKTPYKCSVCNMMLHAENRWSTSVFPNVIPWVCYYVYAWQIDKVSSPIIPTLHSLRKELTPTRIHVDVLVIWECIWSDIDLVIFAVPLSPQIYSGVDTSLLCGIHHWSQCWWQQ